LIAITLVSVLKLQHDGHGRGRGRRWEVGGQKTEGTVAAGQRPPERRQYGVANAEG
jgi:hypothetical protein